MSEFQDVLFSTERDHGRIVLNRPDALNALTIEMIDAIDARLQAWEGRQDVKAVIISGAGDQAFCAGGDVKALYAAKLRGDLGYLENFFRREYTLIHRISTYAKPIISVLDGVTMGGGAGIGLNCSHPVVTDRTVFGMPECRIGLFPDVGTGYFLNRCARPVALALGLTGLFMRGPGVYKLGLSNYYLSSNRTDAITIDNLGAISQPSPRATIMEHIAGINAVFGLKTLEEIVTVLSARDDPWAKEMQQNIAKVSPTSLKVTFAHLNRARDQKLAEVLKTEFRLSQHFMAGHDFFEGVRAHLIDKDRAPEWQPSGLAAVSNDMVEAYFAPVPGVKDWGPAVH